jgi:DNA repair protein RadC
MLELTKSYYKNLKSQNAKSRWGRRRTLPYAFTDQGVLMLSIVLKSEKVVSVNIRIIRTFIWMRELLVAHKDLIIKVEKMGQQMDSQCHEIKVLFEYIKGLNENKDEKDAQQSRKRVGYKMETEL